jgi:hypothetical protein
MQDYGGPVGFRLVTQRTERVKGFIIQNANAYIDRTIEDFVADGERVG